MVEDQGKHEEWVEDGDVHPLSAWSPSSSNTLNGNRKIAAGSLKLEKVGNLTNKGATEKMRGCCFVGLRINLRGAGSGKTSPNTTWRRGRGRECYVAKQSVNWRWFEMACLSMGNHGDEGGVGSVAAGDGMSRWRNTENGRQEAVEGSYARVRRWFVQHVVSLLGRSLETWLMSIKGVVVVDCSLASVSVDGDESQPGKRGIRGRMLSEISW